MGISRFYWQARNTMFQYSRNNTASGITGSISDTVSQYSSVALFAVVAATGAITNSIYQYRNGGYECQKIQEEKVADFRLLGDDDDDDDDENSTNMKKLSDKTIIFDLGKVLIKENPLRVVSLLDKTQLLLHTALHGHKPTEMRVHLFDFMERTYGKGTCSVYPKIFEDWLKGLTSNEEVRLMFEKDLPLDVQLDKSTKQLIMNLCDMIFEPETFSKIMTLHSGAKVLEKIPEGVNLYLITNYNDESFDKMTKRYPDLFARFRDVLVSGKVKMMKPCSEIFLHAISNWKLDPKNVLYIDDEFDNVETARKLGFQTVHYKSSRVAHDIIEEYLNK